MVIIATLMFMVAIFLVVRELQLKRLQSEAAKVALLTVFERRNSLLLIKRKVIKIISKVVQLIPFARFKEAERKRLIEERAEKEFTVDEFIAYRLLMGVVGLFLYLMLFSSFDIAAVGVLGIMVILPQYELKEKKQKYKRELLKALPSALDLIAVCVEAGLTFDGAVLKYIQKTRENVLRKEFEVYMKDMTVGRNRSEALDFMAGRVNIKEFTSFAAAILQSEKLGISIAGTLRLQNQQIRIQRTQNIEKLAAQAPVKLMLPLVLFILPVVFIVILGPIALKLISQFR